MSEAYHCDSCKQLFKGQCNASIQLHERNDPIKVKTLSAHYDVCRECFDSLGAIFERAGLRAFLYSIAGGK